MKYTDNCIVLIREMYIAKNNIFIAFIVGAVTSGAG
jgi:hypothetical protein